MPIKHHEEGEYELFETTKHHRILVLDGQKWAAWVEGQAGEILVETDEDHEKDHTLGQGEYKLIDFDEDPKFKDMPHLFLEQDGVYHEVMLPKGWPDSSDKQRKIVDTDHDISKDDLDSYLEGGTPRGEGEERMSRPGGGSMANITHHLEGFDFPGKNDDLVDYAEKNDAPSEVVEKLESLPSQNYQNMADVTQEIGEQTEDLPIEDYDKLSAQEAAEKVRGLSGHDLELVESHEKDNKGRATVLKAIDATKANKVPDDYDEMKTDEVLDLLEDASKKKVEAIEAFEKEHMDRKQVLEAIRQHKKS